MMSKKIIYGFIVLTLTGCAIRETTNILDLDDVRLKNNHSSIEQLYEAWILPVSEKDAYGFHRVRLSSAQKWYDAQNSLEDGFNRFCNLKQGEVERVENSSGFDLICRYSGTKLVGKLMLQRFESNISLYF